MGRLIGKGNVTIGSAQISDALARYQGLDYEVQITQLYSALHQYKMLSPWCRAPFERLVVHNIDSLNVGTSPIWTQGKVHRPWAHFHETTVMTVDMYRRNAADIILHFS